MRRQWNEYKHRFFPWICLNFNKRAVITPTQADLPIDNTELLHTLHQHIAHLTPCKRHNQDYLLKTAGYCVSVGSSALHNRGVFVTEGVVRRGALVGVYPGTIYCPGEAILLQSISNSYIFQCSDGMFIDGKNTGLSRMIFGSCSGRHRLGEYPVTDVSWLDPGNALNPLSCGQIVNNGGQHHANVCYHEVDLDLQTVKLKDRRWILNVPYSDPVRYLRTVVLIAIRDIEKGEELLSSYFSVT